MDGGRVVGFVARVLAIITGISGLAAGGGPDVRTEAFAARLIRPDRQAEEVLRLFRGARWRDPAAALAAWKQQRPASGLGKPAEAVIALFNPEMVQEWRALDAAELRIGIDGMTGAPRWSAVVTRDDGTVAAGVTAMRMTNPDDRPLMVDGRTIPVARVGRTGMPLTCQIGSAVVVANSRDGLERGVALARGGSHPTPGNLDLGTAAGARVIGEEGGIAFRVEPDRLPLPPGGSLTGRRLIEALHAFECRRLEGAAFLKDGALSLDVSTSIAAPAPKPATRPAPSIDPRWLEGLPSDRIMGMISLAIDPESSTWDRAFAAADRVERVDPARAGLAPLRTRLNLLALGAGLNLEAVVRPHLRGISACVIGDLERPGRVAGGIVLLHLDDPEVADRLVRRATPRLAWLVGDDGSPGIVLRARGPDVRVAWGQGSVPAPGRSVASLCDGWGRRRPARVGAFWPGRIWRPARLTDSAGRALAEDPPVIWWGWDEASGAHDVFRWAALGDRVRGFLAALPAAADSPLPAVRLRESDTRISDSKSKN